MTQGKRIGVWVLAIVILLMAALVIIVATFDWNRLKPTINQHASEALNRQVSIDGDLDVNWLWPSGDGGWRHWFPWPRIHAEDIRIGSPSEVTDADLVSLKAIDITLSPLPLFAKTLSVPAIALNGGEATLMRLEDGRNNWTFDLGSNDQKDQAKDEGSKENGWTVDVGAIDFDPIDVHYRDAILAANIDATVQLLGKPIAFKELTGDDSAVSQTEGQQISDYRFGWKAEGTYREQPFSGSGKLGGPEAFKRRGVPYPAQAEIDAGDTQVAVNGTITDPLSPQEIDMDLSFSGQNLGALYDIIGVTLPDTPPYSTRGHLTANLGTQDALSFRYRDFDGQIGDSDIHGDLTYRMGEPRPLLKGEVISQQLRFADLAPLIGADSNAKKADRGETNRQPDDKLLPVEAFDAAQWKTMDADVKFTAKRVEHGDSLPLEDIYTHVRLDDGEILLDPLRFGIAGGNLNTTLRLDGSQTPMQSRVDMHIRHLMLSRLFPDVELMDNSRGELNGDATLSGTGNSVADILGSSNGDLQMLVNEGLISQNLMELAGLNVGNYVVGKLFGDEQVKINCAAANFNVTDGLAKTRFFLIDTENALVKIDGTANFGNEALDLTIEPESKGARVFTLRSPLYVKGTFKNPSPGVDTGSLLARGAIGAFLGTVATPAAALLALVSPSADGKTPCNDFLSQIQTD
ncbi:AsmA family protein [Salinicola halimionae]|uniref:AsmA family protein n=1 Tax=Salinicola halimionae TaxID=1949081 RepID=UPI000DA14948|nr:AsmA family protein [Salinicola halimionae]